MDIQTYIKNTRIGKIALWGFLALTILSSIVANRTDQAFFVSMTSLSAGIFLLAGAFLAILYGLSPVPGRIHPQVRLVYGLVVSFVLFIAGAWVIVSALIRTIGA